MSLISLRESLARSKAKLKKRLHISLSDKFPTSSTQTPGPESRTNKNTWSAIKSLLDTLESSTEALGPLRSVFGRLNRCIDILENASKSKKEYDELRTKLEGILSDLAEHTRPPMDLVLTNSVKRLCGDIETELRSVEEVQARNTGRRLVDAIENSDDILECYGRIHNYLERLTLNATMDTLKTINKHAMEAQLARMSPSTSAIYNSAESDDLRRGGCTPGTRVAQIDLLLEWARNPDTGQTCWINGMAGTGKTTIAYSVCSELEKTYELAASFFCSRSIPECRQIKYIIPSIAYQLARFSFPYRCALIKILEDDPDVHARALKTQYAKLIVEPLVEAKKSLPTDLIVVIDALDECENENSVAQILDLFLSTVSTIPLRFLVSSRPENEIYKQMMAGVNDQGSLRLVLHDLDTNEVQSDIEVYMRRELAGVHLTAGQWSRLIDRCGVLFIYASTTCRYIKQEHDMQTLDEALEVVFGSYSADTGRGGEQAIDKLYHEILVAAFDKSKISQENRTRMRNVLETVICAQEPLTLNGIAELLGLKSAEQVDALLKPLRSVLNVAESSGLVTTLHASFPDFMCSSHRSAAFCCNQAVRHRSLAETCLRLVHNVEPKFNICGLESSYLLDAEVEDLEGRVRQCISPGLMYACLYWSAHLDVGEYCGELIDAARGFFSSRLLIWMEILSLTRNMRFGTSVIREAENWCRRTAVPEGLKKIAQDAKEFVSVYANHPVSQSTPHIYISMLPFWPRSRPLSAAYMPRTSGMVKPEGTAIERQWSALLATWKVSTNGISSMSLSADGARILATDGTAFLVIDTSTGNRIRTLDEEYMRGATQAALTPDETRIAWGSPGGVYLMNMDAGTRNTTKLSAADDSQFSRVIFSHDGSLVAFTSHWAGSAYICGAKEGEPVSGPMEGHAQPIFALAFSPNDLNLATGSLDRTIRIWDTRSGRLTGKPLIVSGGHYDDVWSISYSPDGSRLASGSLNGTIRVWDLETGETALGPLKEHSDAVTSIEFSPNGAFIASGSSDRTIRVYDAKTGQTMLGPLVGHASSVSDVIFSLDSTQLFSSSADGTVRVWSAQNLDPPYGSLQSLPFDLRYARYSFDGSRAVSSTSTLSGMVYVWDIRAGHMVLGPLEGHINYITALDYSPDGACIVSSSLDRTLRMWDALDGRDLHGPMHGYCGYIECVRFSPDSSMIASGSEDGTVGLWDVQSGELVKRLKGHSSEVISVAFLPTGLQIVSGSVRNTLQLWDTQTDITLAESLQYRADGSIDSVDFLPDGSCILFTPPLGPLRIWEPQTGQTYIISDHLYVRSAAFSPNGRLVVSGGYYDMGNYYNVWDEGIRVWDVQTRQLILGPLFGHIDVIRSVQFSPDGSHVMSSSDDGTIRFWDVSIRRGNTRTNRTQDDSNPETTYDKSDPWSLDKNGWVVDRQNQKLVWIPGDLRICLLRHPNDSIICHRGSLQLNLDGVNIGELWTRCYLPDRD